MKEKGNFSFGWYLFALVCGLGSGLMFSKSAYYKGQEEAYENCRQILLDSIDQNKQILHKEEEEA